MGRLKQPRNLRRRKGDAFAKGVDRVDQASRMGGVQRGDRDLVDIGIAAPLVFGWDGMGGKMCGQNAQGPMVGSNMVQTFPPEIDFINRLRTNTANAQLKIMCVNDINTFKQVLVANNFIADDVKAQYLWNLLKQ